MLSSSGKVYGLGDNSYSQVYAERSTMDQIGDRKSIDNLSRSGTEKTPTQSQSIRSGMVGGGGTTVHLDKTSEYQENPKLVAFDEYNSKSLYKVHAFNNTSLAVDRSGDLYFWGEDTFRVSDSSAKIVKFPILLNEVGGLRISKDSKLYFISRNGTFT